MKRVFLIQYVIVSKTSSRREETKFYSILLFVVTTGNFSPPLSLPFPQKTRIPLVVENAKVQGL